MGKSQSNKKREIEIGPPVVVNGDELTNITNATIDSSNITTSTISNTSYWYPAMSSSGFWIEAGTTNNMVWGGTGYINTQLHPFENGFPDYRDFVQMCEEYPTLNSAYEKLKTVYQLVQDDWESKKK